jgi:hypothetical protein
VADTAEDFFQGLNEFYPGSKRKRREPDAKPTRAQRPDPSEWDAVSYTKKVNGKAVEFFTIGALAKALGKSEASIRLWQSKGYMPNTPYRLPAKVVNGRTIAGRRLFTRSMIESAITAFARRDLLDAKRVEWRDHKDLSIEILESWKQAQDNLSA